MKLIIYCDDEKDIPDQVAHINIDGLQKVLEIIVEHLQTRVDEQRNAPVQSEQKCPLCKGRGWLRGQGDMFKCYHCNGTGISNRSDGG